MYTDMYGEITQHVSPSLQLCKFVANGQTVVPLCFEKGAKPGQPRLAAASLSTGTGNLGQGKPSAILSNQPT